MKNTAPELNQVLIADIGGTNARFAIAQDQQVSHLQVMSTQKYPQFNDALGAYQQYLVQHKIKMNKAVLALAAPITSDVIQFTNSSWIVDKTKVCAQLQCEVGLINDFQAQALALRTPGLKLHTLNQPNPTHEIQHITTHKRQLILGPGTGLGVAYAIAGDIIATEAGHITIPSLNDQEFKIYKHLQTYYRDTSGGHVSAERVCSGPGLEALYRYFWQEAYKIPPTFQPSAQAIHSQALQDPHSIEAQTIQQFLAYFGVIASQLALSMDTTAGVYLTGGITQKMEPLFLKSKFMQRFQKKGRYAGYLSQIPVWIIQNQEPALLGMAFEYGQPNN